MNPLFLMLLVVLSIVGACFWFGGLILGGSVLGLFAVIVLSVYAMGRIIEKNI